MKSLWRKGNKPSSSSPSLPSAVGVSWSLENRFMLDLHDFSRFLTEIRNYQALFVAVWLWYAVALVNTGMGTHGVCGITGCFLWMPECRLSLWLFSHTSPVVCPSLTRELFGSRISTEFLSLVSVLKPWERANTVHSVIREFRNVKRVYTNV